MAAAAETSLSAYCRETAVRAKRGAAELAQLSGERKNAWLKESAQVIRARTKELLIVNEKDVAAAPAYGLTDASIDRLKLTTSRIEEIAIGLEAVAALPDPVGEVIESSIRPNGLQVLKTRVPLGVVFFIYESRANVTADAAAICVKSGNAVILRGGKEAAHSSRAVVQILQEVGKKHGLPADAMHLVNTPDRDAVSHFLSLPEYIDLAI